MSIPLRQDGLFLLPGLSVLGLAAPTLTTGMAYSRGDVEMMGNFALVLDGLLKQYQHTISNLATYLSWLSACIVPSLLYAQVTLTILVYESFIFSSISHVFNYSVRLHRIPSLLYSW